MELGLHFHQQFLHGIFLYVVELGVVELGRGKVFFDAIGRRDVWEGGIGRELRGVLWRHESVCSVLFDWIHLRRCVDE